MSDDNNNIPVPAVTPGEALSWATMILTTLPHQQWGLGIFYGLSALVAWGLRRQPEIRALAENALAEMEQNGTPKLLTGVVRRIPVPPAGVPKLLEDKNQRQGNQNKRSQTLEMRPEKEKLSLGKGLTGLLGDDNPLGEGALRGAVTKKVERTPEPSDEEPVFRPARADRTAGAETKANKAITAASSPAGGAPVDAWLASKMEQTAVKVLRLQDVVDALNEDIDDNPMVLIVGNSGAGKTVLAQLLVGTRPGKVVILDQKRPKGWEGPKWGGLPYVGRDLDGGFTAMEAALSAVVDEMVERYQTQETATEPFQQLTVVLDEAKNTLEEAPVLADYYRKIVSIGREVGVRLILISTTDRARKLGFDGEADSLDSFTWVRLGDFATKVLPEVADRGTDRYYHAVVRKAGQYMAFENELAFGLVRDKLVLKASKAWGRVEYNCQIPKRERETNGSRPSEAREVPLTRPAQPVTVVAAQQRVSVPPQPRQQQGDDFDLLGELLAEGSRLSVAGGSVKSSEVVVDAEEVAVVGAEVPRDEKSQIGTSNAENDNYRPVSGTAETPVLRLKEVARLLGTVAAEERGRTKKVLHSMASGATMSAAIRQEYGVSGGRVFSRAVYLVKLEQEAQGLLKQLKK